VWLGGRAAARAAGREKNKKEPLGPFIDAWKQMGSQALSLKYD